MKRSVLFVCMGNICRSPTGEGLMRQLVAEHGLEAEIEVDSAGTIAYHAGEPPDPRMREAAARRGYRLDGRARQIRREDFARFDLIVAMDRNNATDILALSGGGDGVNEAEVRLLSEFLPAGAPADVPDPYYGGAKGFETVLDMIEQACPAILARLVE